MAWPIQCITYVGWDLFENPAMSNLNSSTSCFNLWHTCYISVMYSRGVSTLVSLLVKLMSQKRSWSSGMGCWIGWWLIIGWFWWVSLWTVICVVGIWGTTFHFYSVYYPTFQILSSAVVVFSGVFPSLLLSMNTLYSWNELLLATKMVASCASHMSYPSAINSVVLFFVLRLSLSFFLSISWITSWALYILMAVFNFKLTCIRS